MQLHDSMQDLMNFFISSWTFKLICHNFTLVIIAEFAVDKEYYQKGISCSVEPPETYFLEIGIYFTEFWVNLLIKYTMTRKV